MDHLYRIRYNLTLYSHPYKLELVMTGDGTWREPVGLIHRLVAHLRQ